MAEKSKEILAKILNLCESDPDAGLEFIEQTIKERPEAKSDPFGKFAKAIAYGSKGLFQLAGIKPWLDFTGFGEEELRDDLGITDIHLDYLEKGLQEIKEMEEIHPGALKMFGTEEDRMGELKVDAMAIVLERCRPGRVQQISGRTKLIYFGMDRVGAAPYDIISGQRIQLAPEDLKPFKEIFFSFHSIARSALIVKKGIDDKGRKFLWVQLFGKTFNKFGAEETLGDVRLSSGLYDVSLFDDGTFERGGTVSVTNKTVEERKNKEKGESQVKKSFFKKLFGKRR